jgi:hypothetical protein
MLLYAGQRDGFGRERRVFCVFVALSCQGTVTLAMLSLPVPGWAAPLLGASVSFVYEVCRSVVLRWLLCHFMLPHLMYVGVGVGWFIETDCIAGQIHRTTKRNPQLTSCFRFLFAERDSSQPLVRVLCACHLQCCGSCVNCLSACVSYISICGCFVQIPMYVSHNYCSPPSSFHV